MEVEETGNNEAAENSSDTGIESEHNNNTVVLFLPHLHVKMMIPAEKKKISALFCKETILGIAFLYRPLRAQATENWRRAIFLLLLDRRF